MKKITQIIGIILIFNCTQAIAEATTETPEPLQLRKIMQDMGMNMQIIVDGISREDWETVEIAALQVADHPQPSFGEKLRILSFAGTNVGTFKDYDGKTHQAATTLGEVAIQKDGEAVISAFSNLQSTCLNCHQNFRATFVEHFYGEQ